MDLTQIASLINKTAKALHDNEPLALQILAAKARREAQLRPNDIPLVNTSMVLTKMASTKDFISRGEFEQILGKFSATHTKLLKIFAEELDKPVQAKQTPTINRAGEGKSLDEDYARMADPVLANALSAAFDKNPQDRLFSVTVAKAAQNSCNAQLSALGMAPKRISTFAGRNDMIVCNAEYETPKGISHVLVPVEVNSGKALLPSLFLTREGFVDLDEENLENHIEATAGKSYKVDGEKLLQVLTAAKNGVRTIDDVEMAAIKVASEKGREILDPSSTLYAPMYDNPSELVKLPEVKKTAEEQSFAEKLNKPDGMAKFIHGDRAVEAGRNMLVRKFAEMGYKGAQVKVADVEDKKIFFAVGIGNHTGFMVPVEVAGNLVMPPKVVIADGTIKGFSKQAIDSSVQEASGGNVRALAASSPAYDLKPSELVNIVKESVASGNLARAEEAITVLGEIDPAAQRIAIAHMMRNIYEPGQNPSQEAKDMSKIADQKVQDLPVSFMTHKIFFPEGA